MQIRKHKWSTTAMSVGTFCSGTDGAILVQKAYCEAVLEVLHVSIPFRHRFACECSAKKQAFIAEMFPDVELMIGNCSMLGSPTTTCVLTGEQHDVPSVNHALGGFPCQDASLRNPKASTQANRQCVSEATFVPKVCLVFLI
jgi:site-specific DNA-cytosine methylase